MNIKLLSISSCAAIVGTIIGYLISSISMPDIAQGDSSIYIADFRTVDAEDGSPINTRMSPGDILIAQITSGEDQRQLSNEFCMHSEVDNGHWRIIWKEPSGGRRNIVLSADGYATINLPSEMIRSVRPGTNITIGGILSPDTLKMNKTQQDAPRNR